MVMQYSLNVLRRNSTINQNLYYFILELIKLADADLANHQTQDSPSLGHKSIYSAQILLFSIDSYNL